MRRGHVQLPKMSRYMRLGIPSFTGRCGLCTWIVLIPGRLEGLNPRVRVAGEAARY